MYAFLTLVLVLVTVMSGDSTFAQEQLPPHGVLRLGTSKLRHGAPVAGLAFSPEGSALASASWDRTISTWDTATGSEQTRFLGHTGGVYCVAISRDGSLLASSSRDGEVRLWNAKDGRLLRVLGEHRDWVEAVRFVGGGHGVVSVGDRRVLKWSIDGGSPPQALARHGDTVRCLAVSADGACFASGADDGTIRLGTVGGKDGARLITTCEYPVSSLALSADGSYLASGCGREDEERAGSGIQVWDTGSGKLVREIVTGDRRVVSLAFVGDTRRLVAAQHHEVLLLESLAGERLWSFDADDWAYVVAVSADARAVAVGTQGGAIHLLHVSDGRRLLDFDAHQEPVKTVDVSDDGTRIVSGGYGATTWTWSSETGLQTVRRRWDTNLVVGVRFVAEQPHVAVSMAKQNVSAIQLWDIQTNSVVRKLAAYRDIVQIAMTPDRRTLAVGGDADGPELWDTASEKKLFAFDHEPIEQITISHDGVYVAAVSDTRLLVWERGKVKPILIEEIDEASADRCWFCGKDGALVAAGYKSGIRLWDVARQQVKLAFESPGENILCFASTGDGRYVAAGCGDGGIRFWDASTGKIIGTLTGHRGPVLAIAFFPDERRLVTGSTDTSLLIWDVSKILDRDGVAPK